ncbi:MAG: DnaJ domain-containing protein [Candidatus Xenobia bacterium]
MQENPWQVLGVAPDAAEDTIRQAYLAQVQAHPPDRSPEAFERIRDAWETLRDPRSRLEQRLFGGDAEAPLLGLVESDTGRHFVGVEMWLAVTRS